MTTVDDIVRQTLARIGLNRMGKSEEAGVFIESTPGRDDYFKRLWDHASNPRAHGLSDAIESAKREHGHRGAEDRLTLYHLMDVHSDESLCMVHGWESVEVFADRFIRLEARTSAVNILRDGSCVATASRQRDGSVRIDRWTAAPSPSEIAGAMTAEGAYWRGLRLDHLPEPNLVDAQTCIAFIHAQWDAVKFETRERKRQGSGFSPARHTAALERQDRNEDALTRVFSLNHSDDYADRLSPSRRHGLD